MGNSQSQASDDDDGSPVYNYHEQVLQEAQNGINNNTIGVADVASDDEHYYSAEEGDSVRSVTPPRTRPESSSGEDFSDSDNDSQDEQEVEQDSVTSANVVEATSPDVNNASRRSNMQSHRSCGQCNISIFQEHDSIAPELEIAHRRHSNSFVGSASHTSQALNSTNRSTAASGSETGQINLNQSGQTANTSPFAPIQPAQVNAGREKSPIAGKRKVARGSESPRGDLALPKKRMATRASSKRKRLRYPESSESESESECEEKNRSSVKRGKLHVSSPKKNRRSDRHARDRRDNISDSDERRYGKRRRTRRSRRDADSESASEDSSTERNSTRNKGLHKEHYKSPGKGRGRRSSDYSSDNSDDKSAQLRKRRSGRQHDKDSDEANEDNGNKSQQKDCHSETTNNINRGEENNVSLQKEHVLDMENASNNDEKSTFTMLCPTLKMGTQSVRNTQGKVFPVRRQGQGNSGNTVTENAQETMPSLKQSNLAIADVSNIVEYLRQRKSAFMTPSNVAIKRKATVLQEMHDGGDGVHVNQNHLTRSTAGMTNEIKHNQANLSSEQGDASVAPFKNVRLIPPSSNFSGNSLSQFSLATEMSVSGDSDKTGQGSDMEVEESDVSMDFQTNVPSQPSTAGIRRFLKGRRRDNTAAERFKHFWSEKKRTIGSNLKSLFSKTISPSSKSLNTSNSSWQSLVTTFSNNSSSSVPLRSQSRVQSSLITYLSSDEVVGPTFTSSPQNQVGLSLKQSGPGINISSLSKSNISPIFSASPPSSQNQKLKSSATQSTLSQNKAGLSGRSSQNRILRSETQTSPIVGSFSQLPTRVSPRLRDATTRGQQKHLRIPQNDQAAVEHLPQMSQFQVLNCRLGGMLELSVSMGNISDQSTAGIVNWTDGALTHQITECSRNVAAKAGALMRAGCNDYIENKGGHLEAPDVLITPAGGRFDQQVEAILHVVAPQWLAGNDETNSYGLVEVYANCLRFAEEKLGLNNVSFPLITNENFSPDVCINAFFDALLIFLAEHAEASKDSDLSSVCLIIPDVATTDFAADIIQSRLEQIISDGFGKIISEAFSIYLETSRLRSVEVERTASGRPAVKRPRL